MIKPNKPTDPIQEMPKISIQMIPNIIRPL